MRDRHGMKIIVPENITLAVKAYKHIHTETDSDYHARERSQQAINKCPGEEQAFE
jgi:hypothetical protein